MGYLRTDSHGGEGGHYFTDDLTVINRAISLNIWHDKNRYVNALQFIWVTEGPKGTPVFGHVNGKEQGELATFHLADGEFISEIKGRSGAYVDSLTFRTNLGTVHGPYGGTGGIEWSMSGMRVDGAFGRCDEYLDNVAFFKRP